MAWGKGDDEESSIGNCVLTIIFCYLLIDHTILMYMYVQDMLIFISLFLRRPKPRVIKKWYIGYQQYGIISGIVPKLVKEIPKD